MCWVGVIDSLLCRLDRATSRARISLSRPALLANFVCKVPGLLGLFPFMNSLDRLAHRLEGDERGAELINADALGSRLTVCYSISWENPIVFDKKRKKLNFKRAGVRRSRLSTPEVRLYSAFIRCSPVDYQLLSRYQPRHYEFFSSEQR